MVNTYSHDIRLKDVLLQVEQMALRQEQQRLCDLYEELERGTSEHSAIDVQGSLRGVIQTYLNGMRSEKSPSSTGFEEARDRFVGLNLDRCAALMTLKVGETLYAHDQYKPALSQFVDAFQLARAYNEHVIMASASENLGIVHLRLGLLDESERWYMQAIPIRQMLGDELATLKVKANLGSLHLQRGNIDAALVHYKEALEGFERNDVKPTVAALATNIGICYADQANYPTAIEYLHKALEIGRETDNLVSLIATTGALGEVYEANEYYEKALYWFEESLKLSTAAGRMSAVCLKRVQLGAALLDVNRLDEAVFQLETAMELAKEIDSDREQDRVSAHLARIKLQQGNLADARELVSQVLTRLTDNGNERDLYAIQYTDAQVSLAEGNVDRCSEVLDRVICATRQNGMEKELTDALLLKSQTSKHQRLYEQALSELEEYLVVNDRIRGKQNQQRLAILEAELKISEQTREHQRAIAEERRLRDQQRALLTNMLPEVIADRLISGSDTVADRFEEVSVLFIDLVNFTGLASTVPPEHVQYLLNQVFRVCDVIMKKHGLTKIKTIGDAYMAVAGAPVTQDDNVWRMTHAALDVAEQLANLEIKLPDDLGDKSWVSMTGDIEIRMGIHCGPVSAGIIGEERMAYDVWGDTVNVAARMEQSGMPGFIQVTSYFRDRVIATHNTGARFTRRGLIEVKGRGPMETWWMHR